MAADPKLPKITDEQVKEVCFACFDAGLTTWLACFSKIKETHQIGRDRSIVLYKQAFSEFNDLKNGNLHTNSIENITNELREGIKSKQTRILELQKMLDDDEVEESVYDFQLGGSATFTRRMKPLERAKIYELISKLQGDFAPTNTNLFTQKFGTEKEIYK